MDYELLLKIARTNPDKTVVLVGPRKDKQFTALNIDAEPNIFCTGPRPIQALPAYLRRFNCTIIPFLKNNLTAGIYPLKINEYLAAGKTVVTTNFSEDINSFAPHVLLAPDHESFLQQLQQAMQPVTPNQIAERQKAAAENAWEHRAEQFWQLLWQAFEQKQSQAL